VGPVQGRNNESGFAVKLQDYRDTFYTFSGKASDLNRQLGFAGIALIWLFKKDVNGSPAIPTDLIVPGVLIVSSLTLDMLHYCVASIIWHTFYRSKEKANVGEDDDIEHGVCLVIPINFLFGLKILCVVAAYVYIFGYLISVFINHTG
jgi:hypothetical protein